MTRDMLRHKLGMLVLIAGPIWYVYDLVRYRF